MIDMENEKVFVKNDDEIRIVNKSSNTIKYDRLSKMAGSNTISIPFSCNRGALFEPNDIFKFKAGNDRDIDALVFNLLWLPKITKLNDPIECNVYYSADNESKINELKTHLDKIHALCFSLCPNNILFNYYGNGFSGFCLVYDEKELEEALQNMDSYVCSGSIDYNAEPDDINEKVLSRDYIIKKTFEKTREWSFEFEKRYLFYFKNEGNDGLYLKNMKPKAVIIGSQMDLSKQTIIKAYCDENNVKLCKCSKERTESPLTVGYGIIKKEDFLE